MDLIMSKIKVFEIKPYINPKTKKVSRRFIDQSSYLKQIDLFKYKNPTIGASHILRCNGKWEKWNDNDWIECDEPVIINNLEEFLKEEV